MAELLVGESMDEYAKRRKEELAFDRRFERRTLGLRKRVMGSGGGGGFAPNQIAGLMGWYKYGVGITSSLGFVSRWADQSGNGNHLLQDTGTNQPLLNFDNSITFDGDDNFMRAAFTLDQPCTFAALYKPETSTSGDVLLSGAAAISRLTQGANETTLAYNAGASLAIASEPGLVWQAFVGTLNGVNSTTQINLGSVTTGDAGANNPGGCTLAATFNGTALWGHVSFKEVTVYSGQLGAEDRLQLARYLMNVGLVTS